jgi:hypothetical protein
MSERALEDAELDFRRRCLLLRAAALFELVDQGAMDSAEALDRLAPAFAALFCTCARLTLRSIDRIDRQMRERALRNWRWRNNGGRR